MSLRDLLPAAGAFRYNFAFMDEGAKREVRRALLKAVAIPGHQVPFASPELPIARGWGTGGLQVTMSLIGPDDVLKIIDQGCDGSVNAVNLRKLLVATTGVRTTFDSRESTLLQSRHRLPEIPMTEGQIAVLQVPLPEPLRLVEPSEVETRRMHAEGDYARMWVSLYEDVVQNGAISLAAGYPCRVNGSYIMSPSPLPRWDLRCSIRHPISRCWVPGVKSASMPCPRIRASVRWSSTIFHSKWNPLPAFPARAADRRAPSWMKSMTSGRESPHASARIPAFATSCRRGSFPQRARRMTDSSVTERSVVLSARNIGKRYGLGCDACEEETGPRSGNECLPALWIDHRPARRELRSARS